MQVKLKNLTYKVTLYTRIKICIYQIILKAKRVKRNLKDYCRFLKDNKLNLIMVICYFVYFTGSFFYNYYRANVEELSIVKIGIASLQQSLTPFLFTVLVPLISNLFIFYGDKRRKLRERFEIVMHTKSVIEECLGKMYPLVKAEIPEKESLFRKLYEYRNKEGEIEREYTLNKNSKVYIAKLLSCIKCMEKALDNEYGELLQRISRGDVIKAEGLSYYVFYSENELECSRYMLEHQGEKGVVNYLYEMYDVLKIPWNIDKEINVAIKTLIENDKKIQANKIEVAD